jgi:aminomethyltransferase
VQGPNAPALLERIFGKVAKLAPFRIRNATFEGTPIYFATTGYTAEDGFELFCANADAPALFRAILAAPWA